MQFESIRALYTKLNVTHISLYKNNPPSPKSFFESRYLFFKFKYLTLFFIRTDLIQHFGRRFTKVLFKYCTKITDT